MDYGGQGTADAIHCTVRCNQRKEASLRPRQHRRGRPKTTVSPTPHPPRPMAPSWLRAIPHERRTRTTRGSHILFTTFTGDTTLVGRRSWGSVQTTAWSSTSPNKSADTLAVVKDWSLYPRPERTSTATAVSGGHAAHPRHRAFELLPSGRPFTMLRAQTDRPRGSFPSRATDKTT